MRTGEVGESAKLWKDNLWRDKVPRRQCLRLSNLNWSCCLGPGHKARCEGSKPQGRKEEPQGKEETTREELQGSPQRRAGLRTRSHTEAGRTTDNARNTGALKRNVCGAPGWLRWLSLRLLIWVLLMVLSFVSSSPTSCLGFSFPPSLSLSAPSSCSLPLSKYIKKKKLKGNACEKAMEQPIG